MPTADDWLLNPLGLVEGLFAQHGPTADWEKMAVSYFANKLQDGSVAEMVPSLNDVPLQQLKSGGVARFRCMVQDMFDPEFYLRVFEVLGPDAQTAVLRCGKYRDIAACGPQQQVNLESPRNVTADRQTFYCVPVPGEAAWVKEKFARRATSRATASTSYSVQRNKRSLEEEAESSPHAQHAGPAGAAGLPLSQSPQAKRKQTLRAPPGGAPGGCLPSADLNFPLPGETGPACIVKVYEDWDSIKLNDIVEVFGILSMDPELGLLQDSSGGTGGATASGGTADVEMETETGEAGQGDDGRHRCPPASLVPRLHALTMRKLMHVNPLLPADLHPVCGSLLAEAKSVRSELLGALSHALLGDELAAEYLLLHLVSSVYARRDVMPLGKFSLNLSGCPCNPAFTQELYLFLQQLVTTSHRLPMSLGAMNGARLAPCKDYAQNRLRTGALQLPNGASLFLDETELQPGQLDATGVRNVTALGNVISWQKVDYDFSFHQVEFPCSLNVLVVSEGRSLLPSDCQMRLAPAPVPADPAAYFTALRASLSPALLDRVRSYLTLARLSDYSIGDEVSKAVEEDFVEMRREDPQVTGDDLHLLLVVARLLSLSVGQTGLTRERWLRAQHLEVQRRQRIKRNNLTHGHEQ
ncbi:mini-chromosome maintenance complex-binding protein [Lampetra fluviatilis]